MAITSVGYDGTIDEAQWAQMIKKVGSSDYGVVDGTDLRVTAVAGADRTVSIAPGTGWGHGVLDTLDANATIALDTVSSGSRWDLVALRRDWTGAAGTTTVVKVNGSSAQALPTGRLTGPGTVDDQPLALVKITAGQTQPSAILDLRCFAGNGGMAARDETVLTYLKQPGTSININGAVWNCYLDGNSNAVWGRSDLPANVRYEPLQPTGWKAQGDIIVESMQGRKRVTVDLLLTRTGGNFSVPTAWITLATFLPTAVRYSNVPNKYLAVALSGGGNNNHATIYVDHRTGVIGMRAPEAFTFSTSAVISVNFVYYIP